ncbi:hypothetical protein [Paenibacillus dakarensis]|uniref:hypothetical protein n=1 Tax=Paenibacillus dakarensis TaxID=1527293 RepID=UPI0006D55800|nr:hypothetical protein [Paenibacillus dakarensis]
MDLGKRIFYISAAVLGLILLPVHHLGDSVGDDLFRWIGISPWSNWGTYGFHLPVLMGLLLLTIGCIGVWKIYSPRYRKIGSYLLIGCIVFIYIFPFMSKQFFFLTKYNSTDISSVAYSKKNSKCTYTAEDKKVKAECKLNIYNYGKLEQVTLRPIINQEMLQANLEPKVVIVPPRSQTFVNEIFYEDQMKDSSIQVWDNDVSVEIEVNGYKKTFE